MRYVHNTCSEQVRYIKSDFCSVVDGTTIPFWYQVMYLADITIRDVTIVRACGCNYETDVWKSTIQMF